MRTVIRFLARYYWEDVVDTLVASVVVLLISLFFANFEHILPLYDPVAKSIPNGHPGISVLFQLIVWPAWVSTIASVIAGLVKTAIKIRGSWGKPKGRKPTGTSDQSV
jgi:hypothetical protein